MPALPRKKQKEAKGSGDYPLPFFFTSFKTPVRTIQKDKPALKTYVPLYIPNSG